jgi:hypothetical protein
MLQITVTLTGKFTDRAATIDGYKLTLAGVAGGPQSATKTVTKGPHTLSWSVNAAPGSSYSVAVDGDTDPWEKTFTIRRSSDDGSHEFSAK